MILFTNDFHSQIEPLSKDETYNADRGGIKRIKALVDSVRAAEPAVLLADAGDFVQGTYYFSLLNGVVESMIMDELEYDVRTIGNHEFDKKMACLGDMLALNDVPVVTSNYDFSMTLLANRVQNSIILHAGNVKVGFIGLNVRLQNLVDPTACEGVLWQNAINVADDEAQKLIDQGADMVIALSHLGYEKTDEVEDVLHVGDEVEVKLLEIDEKTGKMRLSRKALLEKPEGYVEPERKPRGDRGPRRDNDRRDAPAENNEQNNEPEMF